MRVRTTHSRRSIAPLVQFFAVLLVGLSAIAASAVDDVDLHELSWYVHVDLVTVTEDLAYWQGVLDQASDRASSLIEGRNGPADTPCCSRISRAVSLATFGTPDDGFDVIDSASEVSNLNGLVGTSGSNAFLVDSISHCGGPAPNSVGCAAQASCTGNGGDDPDLWLAVTVDSLDASTLPLVIAHERGHNACLPHVASNACQIMQGTIINPGIGGCFTASECSNFQDARTTTSSGLDCSCHMAAGVIEPDETACSDFSVGYCSGGLCGEYSGDALVKLLAAAHPGSAGIPAPDQALTVSALSGNWIDVGQITPMAEDVHGMAYAADYGVLFGVIPTSGNDSIVTIDSGTGDVISVVGSISNGGAELISMAYHPGATSSPVDDRLILMEVTGVNGTIVWIDPASPSIRNVYGAFLWVDAADFSGLAYDSLNGKLFASSPYGGIGLYEIDLTSCPPSPCISGEIVGPDSLTVEDGSLTFSPHTGMLYQIGTFAAGSRTFYNVIDPLTGASAQTLSLDPITPGALAAVPEPSFLISLLAGSGGLLWATRRQMGSLRDRELGRDQGRDGWI